MKRRTLLSLAMATLIPLSSWSADFRITVVTENTPITRAATEQATGGEATRFVEALLKRADIDYELRYVPWRRGYEMAKQLPNTLIFPLARTAHREADFHWVGEMIPIRYYLFRLKNQPELALASLDAAREHRIGVVNYHAHHEYLLQQGFKQLQPVNSSEQNIRKLLRGRIDFFPMSDGGIFPLCQRTGIDCKQLAPAVLLEDISRGLYMAFGLKTDKAVIERTEAAFREMIEDGSHQTIFAARLRRLEQFENSWK